MKILAFAGSNSSRSINDKLIRYVTSLVAQHEVKHIRLTDFDIPMFSEDLEREEGYPVPLRMLKEEISSADAFIISVNEHNGGPSAFFKNIVDWLSRLEYKFLADKKVLLMSTSDGQRGAAASLEYIKSRIPRHGGEVMESFSFPGFKDNFSTEENKITNEVLAQGFKEILENFEQRIK